MVDNYVMMNAHFEVSKQLTLAAGLSPLAIAAIFNYANITRKLREICDVLRLFEKISVQQF